MPSFRPSYAVIRVEETSLRVQQPQSQGDLISLAMGEPDLPTPAQVRASLTTAVETGVDDILITHGGSGAHARRDPHLHRDPDALADALTGAKLFARLARLTRPSSAASRT